MKNTYLVTGLLCMLIAGLVSSEYVIVQFHDNNHLGAFNHIVVNKNTGKLYLGAVNKLYQLAADLTQEISIKTGPQLDNPNCPMSACEGRKMMESYNKLLAIDYQNESLIFCTSLFHGVCEKRELKDITQKDMSLKELPMVANDATSSTVAFTAPGAILHPGNSPSDALYIAVSWTNVGIEGYRSLIPAFCVRNLTTFNIYYKDVGVWSKIQIEAQQHGNFPVHYVYGFPSSGFSYMLSVQRADINSQKYVSKIFRVCQNDKKFYSYTELQLTCMHLGADYNLLQAATIEKPGFYLSQSLSIPTTEDVLFAVFSLGHPDSAKPTASSALCIYPVSVIQKIFRKNIKDCFNGNGKLGPNHFMPEKDCVSSKITLDDPYCGQHDINTPVAGHIPIKSEAVLGFKGQTPLASISVAVTHKYTVAFVGLKNGHLRKVSIKSMQKVGEYQDLTVDEGSAVNADMPYDLDKKHLYVMTERKVSKLKVQDCKKYTSCLDCLGAKDPYCGWCSLENRCTIRSRCPSPEIDLRWMPYDSDKCTSITRVEPHQIQRKKKTRTKLNLIIQSLPSLSGVYICMFSKGTFNYTVIAELTSTGVRCETPPYRYLPPFHADEDHIVLRLAVKMDGKEFVATNFTIFDTSVHKSCTGCTMSKFPSTWCIRNHMCTHRTENCLKDDLVTGRSVQGVSLRPGPKKCPMFNHSDSDIHVTSGKSESVKVIAINLMKYQKTNLKCFFGLKSGVQVDASVIGDRIQCSPVQFDYDGNQPSQNVPFQILWGNSYPLDNPYGIQVKMYKCNAMATSCGQCLTIASNYECGWCEQSRGVSVCSIRSECSYGNWLNKSSNCPNPRIIEFFPLSGPKAGGTNVTIIGLNLGKDVNDVINGVEISGKQCIVYEREYKTATRIVCRTVTTDIITSGQVKVTVAGQYMAISREQFHFVEPVVTSVFPAEGPIDGGTRVTISGEYLNAGSLHSIYIGKHSCAVDVGSISSTSIQCITSISEATGRHKIKLHIDKFNKIFSSIKFNYKENAVFDLMDEADRKSIVRWVQVYNRGNMFMIK